MKAVDMWIHSFIVLMEPQHQIEKSLERDLPLHLVSTLPTDPGTKDRVHLGDPDAVHSDPA